MNPGKREASDLAVRGHDDPESLPWVEKYRPTGLEDVLSQQNIVNTIERLIEANRLPHMLFYGPAGTGKTSTILACARKMYGKRMSSMILELNASDERGIDVVRDQIKSFASTRQIFSSGCKLIILDEADSMTKAAQFSLRRVIEKYTKNTRFCIICNYINSIIPALQSRCTRFRFSPLQNSLIRERLTQIAEKERVDISPGGLDAVLAISGGDMRKCLNTMQCTNMAHSKIDEESVYACTGNPSPADIEQSMALLFNASCKEAREGIRSLQVDKGLALLDIVRRIPSVLMLMQDLPPAVLCYALIKLADIEHRLTRETSEKIQLGSLLGIFQNVRAQAVRHYQQNQ